MADKPAKKPKATATISPAKATAPDPEITDAATIEDTEAKAPVADKPAAPPSANKVKLEPSADFKTEDAQDDKDGEPAVSDSIGDDADKDDKAPNADDEDLAAKRAAERQAQLDKIAEAGTYHLPINQVVRRRSRHVAIAGAVLIALLVIAWVDVALDAKLITIPGVQPVTHIFSK